MDDWFEMQDRVMRLAEAGREVEALELARQMSARFPERSFFNWHPEACLLVRLGRGEEGLARLEAALAGGDLWRVRYLEDPDYDAVRQTPRFQAVLEGARARAAEGSPALLTADAPRAGAPLLLVLHGAGSTAAPELERWRPAAGLGYLVAALQSSQPAGRDVFCWDDRERSRADVRWALERLPPRGRVVLAGFSQGAALALSLALEAALVQPGGAVLVAPAPMPSLPPAARRLRVAVLTGGADPIAARAEATLEALVERGHHVYRERVDGLSHEYPSDFAERLPRLLGAATRLS